MIYLLVKPMRYVFLSSVILQMMCNVDGHSWALCAINEERPTKIFTPLNKEQIPITDSPVVVQQHNIPPQKFVLLSAKVKTVVMTLRFVYSLVVSQNNVLLMHTKCMLLAVL